MCVSLSFLARLKPLPALHIPCSLLFMSVCTLVASNLWRSVVQLLLFYTFYAALPGVTAACFSSFPFFFLLFLPLPRLAIAANTLSSLSAQLPLALTSVALIFLSPFFAPIRLRVACSHYRLYREAAQVLFLSCSFVAVFVVQGHGWLSCNFPSIFLLLFLFVSSSLSLSLLLLFLSSSALFATLSSHTALCFDTCNSLLQVLFVIEARAMTQCCCCNIIASFVNHSSVPLSPTHFQCFELHTLHDLTPSPLPFLSADESLFQPVSTATGSAPAVNVHTCKSSDDLAWRAAHLFFLVLTPLFSLALF